MPIPMPLLSLSNRSYYQTYTFARDDRTYRAFTERLSALRAAGEISQAKLGGRLSRQVKVLERELEGRQETMRRKVDGLREALDGTGK